MLNLDKPLLLTDAINTKILYDDLHYYASSILWYVFEFILLKWNSVERGLDWDRRVSSFESCGWPSHYVVSLSKTLYLLLCTGST